MSVSGRSTGAAALRTRRVAVEVAAGSGIGRGPEGSDGECGPPHPVPQHSPGSPGGTRVTRSGVRTGGRRERPGAGGWPPCMIHESRVQ